MIDFTQGVSTMFLHFFACNSKLWLAPYFIDLHPSYYDNMTTWFLFAVDRNSGWVPESCCYSWCIFVLSCGLSVLRYVIKVSKYVERILSVFSSFPNMKGFYWAVRIFLSCNQLKNNFDLSCPKLSLTCPKLSLTCPKLSLTCPKLSLTWPKLSPAVPGYYLAVPKAVTDG